MKIQIESMKQQTAMDTTTANIESQAQAKCRRTNASA